MSYQRRGACGIHLTGIRNGTTIHFPVDCGCWSCPHCVETTLRPRLRDHLLKLATKQGTLHYSKCREWQRVYNRLRGQAYFRLTLNGTFHVFTAKPIADSRPLEEQELTDTIRHLVRKLPYDACPYSSCRCWSLKVRQKKKDYEIICRSKVPVAAMQAAAQHCDIPHRVVNNILTFQASRADALQLIAFARTLIPTSYPSVTHRALNDNSCARHPARAGTGRTVAPMRC